MKVRVDFIKDGKLSFGGKLFNVENHIIDVPEDVALELSKMVGYTLLETPASQKVEPEPVMVDEEVKGESEPVSEVSEDTVSKVANFLSARRRPKKR